MSSSDDDVPLAVVAEKVKQKSEVVDKRRPKKDVKKRKIETGLQNLRRAIAIKRGGGVRRGSPTLQRFALRRAARPKPVPVPIQQINEKGGEGEVVNGAGSESGSDKEGSKPSTSSPDNTETRKTIWKRKRKGNSQPTVHRGTVYEVKTSQVLPQLMSQTKKFQKKLYNSKGEKEGKEKRSEDNGSEKPNRRKKMSRKEEKTMKHHGSSSEEDEEETEEKW
ncbi:hypothetical protein OSTOST_02078 [Ostertagia ostertagi]